MGLVFNHFLPASIGGDAAKVYTFYGSRKERLASITAAVVFDRAMGLLGLCFLALGGTVISYLCIPDVSHGSERGWLYQSLAALVVAAMVAIISLIGLSRLKFITKIPESRRIFRVLKAIFLDLSVFSHRLWLSGYCCLISVCIHLLSASGIYSLTKALSGEADLGKTMILGPLVFLANIVPVSIGNIGWSEYVGYLVWNDHGLVYGGQIWLAQRLVAILVSLPGLLLFLQHKRHEG